MKMIFQTQHINLCLCNIAYQIRINNFDNIIIVQTYQLLI